MAKDFPPGLTLGKKETTKENFSIKQRHIYTSLKHFLILKSQFALKIKIKSKLF